MATKRHTPEEIIKKLRTVDILKSKGHTEHECCRQIGISPVTLRKWRHKFGKMDVSQAKRLKELEQQNAYLKRLVADKELDILILKEVAGGKY